MHAKKTIMLDFAFLLKGYEHIASNVESQLNVFFL